MIATGHGDPHAFVPDNGAECRLRWLDCLGKKSLPVPPDLRWAQVEPAVRVESATRSLMMTRSVRPYSSGNGHPLFAMLIRPGSRFPGEMITELNH